jgi:hypothetical protein
MSFTSSGKLIHSTSVVAVTLAEAHAAVTAETKYGQVYCDSDTSVCSWYTNCILDSRRHDYLELLYQLFEEERSMHFFCFSEKCAIKKWETKNARYWTLQDALCCWVTIYDYLAVWTTILFRGIGFGLISFVSLTHLLICCAQIFYNMWNISRYIYIYIYIYIYP